MFESCRTEVVSLVFSVPLLLVLVYSPSSETTIPTLDWKLLFGASGIARDSSLSPSPASHKCNRVDTFMEAGYEEDEPPLRMAKTGEGSFPTPA